MNLSATALRLSFPVVSHTALSFPTPVNMPTFFSGDHSAACFQLESLSRWRLEAQNSDGTSTLLSKGNACNKTFSEGYDDKGRIGTKEPEFNEIDEGIDAIKAMLGSMDDGEISVSAFATAWVALVHNMHGKGGPQFPSSLQWIVENQLSDGSWGDGLLFSAHDRIISTMACVVALKSWDVFPEKCDNGMSFLQENLSRLEHEDEEHMTIGFEIAFPSLIEIARSLHLEFPYDSPILQNIYAKRNLKFKRIPKENMHMVPTTLLFSLEGMSDLDWEKLLKLRDADGSFLSSPSSTAFALEQTKDEKCLKYLQMAVEKFNGGVPNVYPVDLFERIWAVDRLERLGISRYFEMEIKDCLDYVYRCWNEDGINWSRNSRVHDIDDTAMGFRLLRLHGYHVSADVFRHFEDGGEFFYCAGQSSHAVTAIFNLNRASQILFPRENILEQAKSFSYKFLREKQSSKKLLDKWIVTKDLPGEVGYALDFPWYTSLPRIATRFYLEQYGGEDDVWIGKTLYRMHCVNNNVYLELAKLDFNKCQALHQLEYLEILQWYEQSNLSEFGVFGLSQEMVLRAYFVAAASIFELEKATERLAWARSAVLLEVISSHFGRQATTAEMRTAFLRDFTTEQRSRLNVVDQLEMSRGNGGLVGFLLETLHRLSQDVAAAHGSNVHHRLHSAWVDWLLTWQQGDGDNYSHDNHQSHGLFPTGGAELLVRTINLCAGLSLSEELFSHPQYLHLARRTNMICDRLRSVQEVKALQKKSNSNGASNASGPMPQQIETEMQELVQCVLESSDDDIASDIKQTFLTVAKSFYYIAHCLPTVIDFHMVKVLFEEVA